MFNRKDPVYILIIIFLSLFSAPAFSDQQQEPPSDQYQGSGKIQHNQIELTEGEKTFLQSHPVISFGTDETWEPFVSRGANGILRGVDIDFIRYINESTGSNIQLVTGRWAEMVKKAKNREIDGLATSAPLKTREPFFSFSDVYVSEFMIVIIPSDSSLEIKRLGDLSGKIVAIQKGNEAYTAFLKLYPAIKVMETASDIESTKMVVEGKADASITGTSTYKTTHRRFLQSIKIGYVASEKPLDLVFSIRKDWPELVSIINKSLASIPQETINAIYLRWFGMNPPEPSIQGKPSIRTLIVDNYYPYTFVNESGEPDGFSVDLMRAVAQVMGIKMEINVGSWEQARNGLKTGEIDFLPMMAYSKERDKEFDFSAPHTIAYDAFFTRKGSPEIRSLSDLRKKKIIVMKDDQAHDYLSSLDYINDDQLLLTGDLQEALRMLAAGKGDAALMPKLVGLIFIKKLNLTNLALAPLVIEEYKRPFSIAVNEGNQELLERLNQGLSILKETDQQKEIFEKWFGIYESSEISFIDVLKYLSWFILAFVLIGVALFFWFVSLKRQVSIRTKDLKEEIEERKGIEEALRESEDKFRNFAEQSIVGIYLISDGVFKYVNPKFAEIFGYSIDECLDNMHFQQLVHPDDLAVVKKQVVRRVSGEINAVRYSFRGIKKNGETIHIEIFGSSMLLNGKTVATGTMLDITERKLAEEEKKKLESQFIHAQKMESIGTLAGGIAHDFNNLLMAIQGRASTMLVNMDASYPDFEHLKGIEDYVESAAELTQQLLGFAMGGKYEVKPTNLNELANKQSRMFGRTKKEIIIKSKYQENIWAVEIDRGQINQVLLNLYVNAWQAMPGGGELYLETENVILDEDDVKPFMTEPGRYVKISVSDTGVGMDKATLERIFDPFFTTKEIGRGTGLGLASVYGIIKNHSGFINVYSEKDKGSIFNIYLPASLKEVIREKKPAGDILKGSETVLFVDDEEMIIEVAEQLLKRLGYKVLTARSGKEAIKIYEENFQQIDIVVLDMIMPDMGGGETYDGFKMLNSKVKVLLSSGYSVNGQATEILDRGCNGFIQKPFRMKELSQKLREILDGK